MNGVASDRRAPHVIRLRGPWEYRPLERFDGRKNSECAGATAAPLPAAGTCHVPTTWGEVFGAGFLGRARFERPFGCPTGLEAGDLVHLVIQGFDGADRVALNNVVLGTIAGCGGAIQVNIAELLLPRNLLAIDVLSSSEPARCRIGEARLEVFGHGP